MLSISSDSSPQRLPYAGFTLAIPSKSRGLPLKNRQIAKPVSRRPVNPTGRKQTERSRFKRLKPILRNRQLCLFRLFNEACGNLGMQPLSHLRPSKPFHPHNRCARTLRSKPVLARSPFLISLFVRLDCAPIRILLEIFALVVILFAARHRDFDLYHPIAKIGSGRHNRHPGRMRLVGDLLDFPTMQQQLARPLRFVIFAVPVRVSCNVRIN